MVFKTKAHVENLITFLVVTPNDPIAFLRLRISILVDSEVVFHLLQTLLFLVLYIVVSGHKHFQDLIE